MATTTTQSPATTGVAASTGRFNAGSGWWVAVAGFTGIAVADTVVGPLALGVLSVALIYQLGLMLQGK